VSSTAGGAYLTSGQHLFRIHALKMPPNLRAGECFIAELEVIESTNPDYQKGQSVSWIRNITKHKEMALADVKAFLAAVAGCAEEDIDSRGADASVGPAQPFAGYLVRCEAWQKPTKAGGEFTRTLWTHVSR
jgi:hypothetical protein